jgi:Ca2+:H+ antiporter
MVSGLTVEGKMELVLAVALGSSIQIAAGMIPLVVLIAWTMGRDLTLYFVSSQLARS